MQNSAQGRRNTYRQSLLAMILASPLLSAGGPGYSYVCYKKAKKLKLSCYLVEHQKRRVPGAKDCQVILSWDYTSRTAFAALFYRICQRWSWEQHQ
jgi:hypothetical protein